jgi:hypothetical protein
VDSIPQGGSLGQILRKPAASTSRAWATPGTAKDWWSYFLLLCAVLAAEALFIAAEKQIAARWGFSLDDSWIHATIARNLASGYGYSFNRGELVGGSTAPLYTLLLALVYRTIGDIVWSAKALGIVFQCVTTVVVFKTMRVLEPARTYAQLTAALIVGISPPLLWASLSGMEISFYLCIVSVGFYFYVSRSLFAATLVWALGIWVRPEGILLAFVGVASSREGCFRRLLVLAPIVIAYAAFNYGVGHAFLPSSVAAKTSLTLALIPRLTRILGEWADLWGVAGPSIPRITGSALPIVLLAIGGAVTFRRFPLVPLYSLGLPLVWTLVAASAGSGARYILYVIGPGAILIGIGVVTLVDRTPRNLRRLALTCLVGATFVSEGIGTLRRAEDHAWNVQNINSMQRRIGEIARSITRPGDALAVNDIGAIGYFSDRYIVDLMGLISPPKPLPENLTLYKPRLLIIFPNWFRRYAAYGSPGDETFCYYDADSTHKYSPLFLVQLAHNTVSARDKMCVFVRQSRSEPPPKNPRKYVY